MGNASALEREVWDEFHVDWEALALECEQLRGRLSPHADDKSAEDGLSELLPLEDFNGETRRVVAEQRIKQHFFRRAVLSSYRGRCCLSGLAEPRLLIASHIVPWSKDRANRLIPSNGLCLSAIHDKAFDRALITLSDEFRVVISEDLRRSDDPFIKQVLLPLSGREIEMPERFAPSMEFVTRHRSEVFIDN